MVECRPTVPPLQLEPWSYLRRRPLCPTDRPPLPAFSWPFFRGACTCRMHSRENESTENESTEMSTSSISTPPNSLEQPATHSRNISTTLSRLTSCTSQCSQTWHRFATLSSRSSYSRSPWAGMLPQTAFLERQTSVSIRHTKDGFLSPEKLPQAIIGGLTKLCFLVFQAYALMAARDIIVHQAISPPRSGDLLNQGTVSPTSGTLSLKRTTSILPQRPSARTPTRHLISD
jgi:hypothetical protein